MEELRSTDILDSEIRNETKKKAEKIVDRAKETAGSLLSEVEAKVEEARQAALNASEKRLQTYEKNVNASLPLEKQRYQISYVHNSLVEAINLYLEKAGEEGRFEIIKELALRVKNIFSSETQLYARTIFLNKDKVKKLLEEIFGKGRVFVEEGSINLISDETVELLKFHEGIILQTEDRKIKCNLTLDEKIREILDSSKMELALALFDGRLPL